MKVNWAFIGLIVLVFMALVIIVSALKDYRSPQLVDAAETEQGKMPDYVTKFEDGDVACYVVVSAYGRDISCVK